MLDLLDNEVKAHTHFYGGEFKLCHAFWKQVVDYIHYGKIAKHSIIGVENNPRSKISGGMNVVRGVNAGVSDYIILSPKVCFLEAKIYRYEGQPRKDGTRRIVGTHFNKNQLNFIEQYAKPNGYEYEKFRTVDEGFYWLKKWGVLNDG